MLSLTGTIYIITLIGCLHPKIPTHYHLNETKTEISQCLKSTMMQIGIIHSEMLINNKNISSYLNFMKRSPDDRNSIASKMLYSIKIKRFTQHFLLLFVHYLLSTFYKYNGHNEIILKNDIMKKHVSFYHFYLIWPMVYSQTRKLKNCYHYFIFAIHM